MKWLLESYCETLLTVQNTLKKTPQKIDDTTTNPDYSLLNSAKSELEYIIEWLSSGRRPGNRRGVERLAAYQRERLYNPQDPEYLKEAAKANRIKCRRLSDDELTLLDSVMDVLSPREKEVYTMIKGFGYSYEYTAEVLGISKSRVQDCMNRAKVKIDEAINHKLQMVMFG